MMSNIFGGFSRTVSRPEEPKDTPQVEATPQEGPTSVEGHPSYQIKKVKGIPDIEYPATLVIKNTFIDTDHNQPTSMMDFYEERKLHSCPNSGIMGASPQKADDETDKSTRGSTSVGGSSPSSSVIEAEDREGRHRGAGISRNIPPLPELGDYSPPAVSVKNTFIHAGVSRDIATEGFFKEREIQSCPASGIGAPPGLEFQGDDTPQGRQERRPSTTSAEMLFAAATAAAECLKDSEDESGDLSPQPQPIAPTSQESEQPVGNRLPPPPSAPPALGPRRPLDLIPIPPPPPGAAPAFDDIWEAPTPPRFAPLSRSTATAPILSLAEAITAPGPGVLGSPEMPTIGSQDHRLGTCKPCAYAHSKGCGNGAQCPFCHLCPYGELKRRQKEKRATQRAVRQTGPMGTYEEGAYGQSMTASGLT